MNLNRSVPRVTKFTLGDAVTTAAALQSIAEQGGSVFFMPGKYGMTRGHKPRLYHTAWLCSMQFRCVMSYLYSGLIRRAVRNPDFPYVFKAEYMTSQVPELSSEWWVTCSEIPSVKITEITRDAVCLQAQATVESCFGKQARAEVRFVTPKSEPVQPVALLP